MSNFNLLTLSALLLFFTSAGADDITSPEPPPSTAASECPVTNEERALETRYGAAGFMKNLAETEDSIKAIAREILASALKPQTNKAANDCDQDCAGQLADQIVYRVAPVAFLPQEKQNQVCLDFEKQTAATPFEFGRRQFKDVEALNKWIMEFSQGRGDDGKKLYEQCGSNCSPRYTFLITDAEQGYNVSAEVLCGLARDKSNDQYLISTAVRRVCEIN